MGSLLDRLGLSRRGGRHALGAAVTQIPSRAVTPAAVPSSAVTPAPVSVPVPSSSPPSDLLASIVELIASGEAWAEVAPPVGAPPPRVQLGFRDGSSTTLDPGSSQSLALEQLASSLTRRD